MKVRTYQWSQQKCGKQASTAINISCGTAVERVMLVFALMKCVLTIGSDVLIKVLMLEMVVSGNREPQYKRQNTIVLIIREPQ